MKLGTVGKAAIPFDPCQIGGTLIGIGRAWFAAILVLCPTISGSSQPAFRVGRLESSVFWSAHFSKIPQAWIDETRLRGNTSLAEEWETMNQTLTKRLHRSRQLDEIDPLSYIHLSMARIPDPIGAALFERKGLATTWARRYRPAEEEVEYLLTLGGLDTVAALFALTKEAGEIGDMQRFHLAKAATIQHLGVLDTDPACRRIRRLMRTYISKDLEKSTYVRRYNRTLHHGFGLPASWRAQITPTLMDRAMNET